MSRNHRYLQGNSASSGEYLYLECGKTAEAGDMDLLMEEGPKELPPAIWKQLLVRINRGPLVQLTIDLSVTLQCLGRENVTRVMENGIVPKEYEVLVHLHKLSSAAQVAAWSLFHIQERQDLVDLVSAWFLRDRMRQKHIPKAPADQGGEHERRESTED